MVAEKSNSVFSQWFKSISSVAVLGAFIAPLHAAPVPVVESQPVSRGGNSQQAVDQSEAPATVNAPQAAGDTASTAYFINTMEQLRQEVMELRGQVEEQQFQINRLQQESRDRYLDLDDRISRINAGEAQRSSLSSGVSKSQTVDEAIDDAKLSEDADSQGKQMDAAEEKAYQAAFQLIRDRQFDEAKAALRKLLEDYPNGRYSDNARYWLGEVQMAQGKYPEAVATFEQVLKDYPQSGKIADATYKLGRLHDLLGDKAKARELLEKVMKDHPDTAAARLSDTYLRGM